MLFVDGKLACWGGNSKGQLGVPPSGNCPGGGACSTKPVWVPGFSAGELKQVALGNAHTCALFKKGTASCWGFNSSGQLGVGSTSDKHGPTAVTGLFAVESIAAGGAHSCAVLAGGTSVACWGSNTFGQLGDGTKMNRTKPVAVQGLSQVLQIALGDVHTCALIDGGTVRCWGGNLFGQLGDGTKTDRSSPALIPSLTNVNGISAGGDHTCVQLTNFSVLCWGSDAYNELGYSSSTKCGPNQTPCSLTPKPVPGLSKLANIKPGAGHICGRHATNSMSCWGANGSGQLGVGSMDAKTSPTPVPGLQSVQRIAVGGAHTCARVGSTNLYCWGSNVAGQLGDGTVTDRTNPKLISVP